MPQLDAAARKAYHARYYAENADKVKASQTRYRVENLEKVKAYGARYRAKNPNKGKAYYVKNAEKLKAYAAGYQAENRDKTKASQARYRAKNHEKGRARQAKYRSRKLACGGRGITARQWNDVLTSTLGLCTYCNKRRPLALDHIVPLSTGGEHDIENAAPACKSCNSAKHKTPLLLWLARRAA